MDIINDPLFLPVSRLSSDSTSFLPSLYFEAWNKENLCASVSEAQKILSFNPEFSFAGISQSTKQPFGLLNTLPLSCKELESLIAEQTSYKDIERMSERKKFPKEIELLLCFSIVGKSDTKILQHNIAMSISRYLIFSAKKMRLPMYVFTREPSVPMHIHLGASPTPVTVFENSRPEDKSGNGKNILLKYL